MPVDARVEIAVEDVEGARAAVAAGAHRIELCASLCEGGLTPSLGLLQAVRAAITAELVCMIRPRGGGFVYTPAELQIMARDIGHARAAGADGVVFGCLAADGGFDVAAMRTLVAAAGPLCVTCHRAFDAIADADAALEDLVALRVRRVLTSGGKATATAGAENLARLVTRAGSRLVVLPGGGVRSHNVGDLLRRTHAREIHSGAGAIGPDERSAPGVPCSRWRTDADEVAALVRAIANA